MTQLTKPDGAEDPITRADPAPPRVRRRQVEGDTASEHREFGRSLRAELAGRR